MTDTPKLDVAATLAALFPDPVQREQFIAGLASLIAAQSQPDPRGAPSAWGGSVPVDRYNTVMPSAMARAMAAAVPDAMIADIVRDNREQIALPMVAAQVVTPQNQPQVDPPDPTNRGWLDPSSIGARRERDRVRDLADAVTAGLPRG
jgi:hypothetical protein